jgi:hypothetical protein
MADTGESLFCPIHRLPRYRVLMYAGAIRQTVCASSTITDTAVATVRGGKPNFLDRGASCGATI